MTDYTSGWRRVDFWQFNANLPTWEHPSTELRIVQPGRGFTRYQVCRDGVVLVDGLDNFLKARLVVRDLVRSEKSNKAELKLDLGFSRLRKE